MSSPAPSSTLIAVPASPEATGHGLTAAATSADAGTPDNTGDSPVAVFGSAGLGPCDDRPHGGGWRQRARVASERGMTTAEYAVGTVAACGFGAVLYKTVTSDIVARLVTDIIRRALTLSF